MNKAKRVARRKQRKTAKRDRLRRKAEREADGGQKAQRRRGSGSA